MNKKSFWPRLFEDRGRSTESGQVSNMILILAVALIIVIVIIFVVIRINATKNANDAKSANPSETPKPVYETTIGEVRFVFKSAVDLGNILKSKNNIYQQDLTTTEKFIQVTIGAQNKGKTDLQQQSWDVGNIIDSDGRNFVSINNQAYYFLPSPNLCGVVLKPEFDPVPCVKLYEVSKASKGLKIEVNAIGSSSKRQESFMDLVVQ